LFIISLSPDIFNAAHPFLPKTIFVAVFTHMYLINCGGNQGKNCTYFSDLW